jgi:UV DNA damage repair endonuclease
MDEKGLPYLGELALANCRDLARLIQWNHEHGIRFFRCANAAWQARSHSQACSRLAADVVFVATTFIKLEVHIDPAMTSEAPYPSMATHIIHRMSSVVFPWIGTYRAPDLPQYEEIKEALAFAGDLARAYDQRVTFHPTHFLKLATSDEALARKSRDELEGHSEILDLMGWVY